MRTAQYCASAAANECPDGRPVLLVATRLSKTVCCGFVLTNAQPSPFTSITPLSLLNLANSSVTHFVRSCIDKRRVSVQTQTVRRRVDGLTALKGRASYLLTPYARYPCRQYEWPEEWLFSVDKFCNNEDLASK